MRITAVTSTDLFAGSAARPLQIIQVNVANDASEPTGAMQVRVDGAGVTTPAPARLTGVPPGATVMVEVPVGKCDKNASSATTSGLSSWRMRSPSWSSESR